MGDTDGRRVETAEQARTLAAHLLDGSRLRPCVVVSRAAGQPEPYADVDKIISDVGDLAEVRVLATGGASWAFSQEMPDKTQVYGGASRVYPVDLAWRADPQQSPLRFAYGRADRERVTEALISDALEMALAAGLVERHRATTALTPASGHVIGVMLTANRALVDTDRGPGAIVPELTVQGAPAERLFRKGMRVIGAWDAREHRLDVTGSLLSMTDLLSGYAVGRQVLARVTRLDDGGCHVGLVPGCRVFVPVSQALVGEGTRLSSVMSLGEVVRASVVAVGESTGKAWQLSLIDVEPDGPSYAVGLLPDGPPWLAMPEVEPEAPGAVAVEPAAVELPSESVTAGAPAAPPTEFDALRLERDELLERLERVDRRAGKLEADRARLRTQLRESQNSLDRHRHRVDELREAASRSENDRALFADPVEQLRFETNLAWARRIPAGEKSDRGLAEYHLGENFLSSWAEVDGIDRAKVVDVIVEVLTGLVHDVPGRVTHQLRVDASGNSPYRSRPDGATCWRVALQQHTPQARRLHYWQLSDGSVELSSVRNHDDFRP